MTVTAIAAGLLVENTSLSLDWTSKIKDVIPDFRLSDEVATRQTSVIDLLGMRPDREALQS